MYNELKKKLEALIGDEKDFIANASNFCSFVFSELKDLNWAGFYFFDGSQLVLGMFQGKPACIRINPGSGVCGNAYEKNKTLVVEDVHKFEGHISCDPDSNSEIVIPVNINGKTIGVFDVDSPKLKRFRFCDQRGLEELLEILISRSDTAKIMEYYT